MKKTKKQMKIISAVMAKKCERATAPARWLQLTKIINGFHSHFFENPKMVNPARIARLGEWYKKQEADRVDLIRRHPTFFCPISGKMLDARATFIVRYEGKPAIVHAEGFEILAKKIPWAELVKAIDTSSTFNF